MKNLKIIICLLITSLIICGSKSTESTFAYNTGRLHSWQWISGFAIAGIGILLNIFSLHLFLSAKDISKMKFSYLFIALNIADLAFSITTTILCSINYTFHRTLDGAIQCQIDTVINVILFVFSVTLLASISYCTERNLRIGKLFTKFESYRLIAICFLFSISISLLSVYLPGGGYYLVPTGGWYVRIFIYLSF